MIKFQDPPEINGGRQGTKHAAIAAELRANPGRWALILEAASATIAAHIKRGAITAWQPAGSFEATARKRPDGKFDIYARYVGAS